MLLAIDIGNTNINLAVFDQKDKLARKEIILTNPNWGEHQYKERLDRFLAGAIWEKENLKSAVIASVVPQFTDIFKQIISTDFAFKPLVVNSDLALGIRINFENPEEIGADRLANAVAINYFFPHQSVIAVDFGTTITFDLIDNKKGYIGGVIAPGIAMVQQSLCEKTALLPQIELLKPANVFGKNTEDSMQAGIYFGMSGLVNSILENLIKIFNQKVMVVATGGGTNLIAEQITRIEKIEPDLTLWGLWKIGELNRNTEGRKRKQTTGNTEEL